VPGFPTVAPGPIILLAAAGFVALAPRRWTRSSASPVVFLIVGQLVTPNFGGSFDGWEMSVRSGRSRVLLCSCSGC
jgi:hypothetical protein